MPQESLITNAGRLDISRAEFFYSSISEIRIRRIVLGFPREIARYINNFIFYNTAKKYKFPPK
jgi:hypothetical protein